MGVHVQYLNSAGAHLSSARQSSMVGRLPVDTSFPSTSLFLYSLVSYDET